MTDITIQLNTAQALQPQQVEHIKRSSPVLLGRYPKSREEAEAARQAIVNLDTKAASPWIAQRAVTFLAAHYFVAEMAEAVAVQIGRDWKRELSDYPQWAIEAAFNWWISSRNDQRGKRPLPGDIAERAALEASILTMGRKQVDFYEKYGDNPPAFLRK